MRRRLENERFAVLPCELFYEPNERCFPLVYFLLWNAAHRQVSVVVFRTPREYPTEHRGALRQCAQREFVLTRKLETEPHFVLDPLSRHEKALYSRKLPLT